MKRYLALLLLGSGLMFSSVACSVTNAASDEGQETVEFATDAEPTESVELNKELSESGEAGEGLEVTSDSTEALSDEEGDPSEVMKLKEESLEVLPEDDVSETPEAEIPDSVESETSVDDYVDDATP